jgi:di/tricarboxylate transporter
MILLQNVFPTADEGLSEHPPGWIVAMYMPVVSDLGKRAGIAVSKLYIPLSYATIWGGLCTMIGTSTNMVVQGLWVAETGDREALSLLTPAWVGVPCALVGMGFLLLTSKWLLPDRKPSVVAADPREYAVEMEVVAGSALVGRSIEEAGLRGLPSVRRDRKRCGARPHRSGQSLLGPRPPAGDRRALSRHQRPVR